MPDANDPRIEQVTFAPGEVLFFENEESYHFFVIESGEVEIYKTDNEGEKIVLGVLSDGQSIGEFAMLDHKPRSATARAITLVQAAKVSEEAYKELITELPDWAVAVMRGMIDRLRHTNDIIRRANLVSEETKSQIAAVEFTPVSDHDALDDDDSPFLSND